MRGSKSVIGVVRIHLRKCLELGSNQCDRRGEGTWELIWVAVIMHAVKLPKRRSRIWD